MAVPPRVDLDNTFGFRDKRKGRGSATSPLTTPANFVDETAMNAAIKAADGTTYTDAYLAKMTRNDKVFALRNLTESAGI